jgi:hypothetical protein
MHGCPAEHALLYFDAVCSREPVRTVHPRAEVGAHARDPRRWLDGAGRADGNSRRLFPWRHGSRARARRTIGRSDRQDQIGTANYRRNRGAIFRHHANAAGVAAIGAVFFAAEAAFSPRLALLGSSALLALSIVASAAFLSWMRRAVT